MSNLATTQAIYAAFGRGDIPGLLEYISDDMRWEDWADHHGQKAGVFYMQPRRGKAGVGEFFASMAGLEMRDFQIQGFMDGGQHVGVICEIEYTIKATGKVLRDQEIHLWSYDDGGKAIRLRHYVDTAKHLERNNLL
jgi:ketosteroid isomerase-like protein